MTRASNLKPGYFRVVGSMPAVDGPINDTSREAALMGGASRSAARHARLASTCPATDHEFTVIIPAYNEERRLPKSLHELGEFLESTRLDYRVIVADDGSTDRTPELAADFGRRFSTVRLGTNGGKGRAVRTAMLAATGQVIAFTDADLPFRLTALREGYDLLERRSCEIVFGSRHMTQSAHVAKRNLKRRLASRAFYGVVKCLVSTDVTDTQCGLKMFSRRAAVEVFSQATVNGFAFDTEVVLLARRLGLAHRCLPVTLINEEASTVSLTRHALPMLWDVIKMRARISQLQLVSQLPIGWGHLPEKPARRAA